MVLVKNWPFFHFLIVGNICQENVYYHILERKNAFLDFKNKKFKPSKNWDFSQGAVHGFGQNWLDFDLFILGNIGQENVF